MKIQKYKVSLFLSYLILSFTLHSRPSTAPGIFVGLPYGKPYPPGLYLQNLPLFISVPKSTNSSSHNVAINISHLIDVLPSQTLKARPFIGVALIEAFFRNQGEHAWRGNLYNPEIIAGLQWLILPHIGFANILGIYTPMNNQGLSYNAWIFNERFALTYFDEHSEATIHFLYGIPQKSTSPLKPTLPHYLNIDLTVVHLFNRLSLGPIAYGSWDTTLQSPWSQFSVGGLIGYDFGPFGLQFWLTKDTNANHWGNYATTGFIRFLMPLDHLEKVNIKKSFEI